MSYAGRTVGHGGPDVFGGEVWIVFEQFILARALGEFSQDQFDGDSRPRSVRKIDRTQNTRSPG